MRIGHGKAASVNALQQAAPPDASPAVHVVDDDESIRFLMHSLLEGNGIGVQTYATAEEFLAVCQAEIPGCLILDLQLPGISGLELQKILIRRGVRTPIIFFTARGSVPTAVTALQNGAVDFIEKPFDYKDLLARICKYLQIDARNRAQREAGGSAAARLALLTPREHEVMQQIVAGRLNKQIADELNIHIKTVEFHRAKIMQKMGVHSVAELVHLKLSTQQ